MSERRHRLNEYEIPEVVHGLRLRLVELLKKRENTREAEIAYRCFTRLLWDKPGRPKYPKFDWDFLEYHIIDGETYINERIVELRARAGQDPARTSQH